MATTNNEPLFNEVVNIYNNYAMGFINRFEAISQVTDTINKSRDVSGDFYEEYRKNPQPFVTFVEGLFRLNCTLWEEKSRQLLLKYKLDSYAWVAQHLLRYRNMVEQVYEWSKVDGVVKPTDQIDENGVHSFAYGMLASENSLFGALFADYNEVKECIDEIMG